MQKKAAESRMSVHQFKD